MFYVQNLVYYGIASCDVCLFLLLRGTNICLRHFCASLLWQWHWMPPHQPSHLASGQTIMSKTDVECYHHCNDYSSGRELQCWMMIMKSLLQLTKLGSPLHLFNMMTLSPSWTYWWHCSTKGCWTDLLPSLWSLEHSVPFVFGSDKLDYCTCSL